ncbi:MAG TPA: glycoside hydrolase family 15 protein [Acidimicrobiales bacterium]|nr:glycoside hydrolase family 15 protein [Acidimicrobiales bacterium]
MSFEGGGDRLPLRARGFVGDTETAALVAADGTVDWWCPGRFDADAAFFRLLDPAGGALRVGPARGGDPRPALGAQSYDGDSLVLRTMIHAGESTLEVVDLLPWRGVGHRAEGRLVRVVTALRGDVDVEVAVAPGRRWRPSREVHAWSEGLAFDGIVVRGCDMTSGCAGRFSLAPGERAVVTVDAVPEDGALLADPLSPDRALDLVDRTRTAWISRLAPLTYDGPYGASVRRSLLVLLGLTYGPTGTVVAAPTTSLPERVGGDRNWDYRYAWIRDASLAIDACFDAGLRDEAERFLPWLRDLCAWADFPLRPFYDVDGGPVEPDERELDLAGWRGSRPVRVGNGAADHLQLDLYADVVAMLHESQLGDPDSKVSEMWPDVVRLGHWLADSWSKPDRGIWEVRASPRQFVGSKLACWAALDRIARLEAGRNPLSLDAASLRITAREIVAWLERYGLAADGGLRSDPSEADLADASLLRVAWRNPWPHEPDRARRTVDRVLRRLGTGALVHRYDRSFADGLEPGEGAFVPASFWAVEALARLGRWDEAHERMEALCELSRPLGLLPEEVDPTDRSWLGNLPQAFSHLSLVRAALALADGPR